MSAIAIRLDRIQEHGGISGREVAQLLSTTPQTVSRWRQGRVTPQPQALERLLMLDWLADQLSEVFTPTEARLWLFSPNPRLEGMRPADLIAGEEIEEVLAIIDRLQSAAYI